MTRRTFRLSAITLAAGLALTFGLNPDLLAQRRGGGASVGESAGPFGPLRWRSIGPQRGGRSIAVAGSAQRPLEYYFGATGGGLWKTTDGGVTWQPVTDGKITASSVGAVAVAPSNPDVVYIGTGESEIRGNIAPGDGVYKSTDAGKTWTHIGLEDAQNISKIRVNPTNPDVVFVAAFGHHAAPNEQRGIFRSKDGGKTWEKVLYRDPKTGGIEVVFDPNNPNVLYASLWEAFRNTYMMSSGGPGSGLFKSTDGGDHWTEISRNPGLPKGVLGKIGMDVSRADSNRVYAQIEAEDGGTFVSDDAGATWKKVSENRDVRQRAFYYTRVFADPKDKDTFYEPNVGFMKSTDGGKSWTQLRPPHGDNHDLWIDPTNPKRFILSNDGGATVTTNGGQTWTDLDFPTAQFYHVITTNDVPYHVCGAQQDNSSACVGSQATSFGPGLSGGGPGAAASADQIFYTAGGGESGYIAQDPKNPDILFAGSYGGLLTRLNRRTRQEQEINPYPDNPMGYATKDIAERFQWTFPIVFSPADPGALYVGSQHVWLTRDSGHSWTKISPDLTRHDPKTMGDSGGPITRDETGVETYATVFTIAPSPQDANLIWTGSDDGYVFITRDGGKNWTNVTPKDMPDFARISLIEASPVRRLCAVRLPNGRLWPDVDEDRQRHRAEPLRARDSRRHGPREDAVPRHRARHLRVVRRRGELAVVEAEPAGHSRARHQGGSARSRHRDAWPRLLRDGQHLSPAPVGRGDDRPARVQAQRRASRTGSLARRRLRAEERGAEGHDRFPRFERRRDPQLFERRGQRGQTRGTGER